MEFPEVGAQCNIKECQTLDFLPIECSYCHMIFCKDHAQTAKHNCTAVIDNVVVEKKDTVVFKCSFDGCHNSDPLEMKCVSCQNHYCLQHRHHGCLDKAPSLSKREKYRLPKEQFKKAKAETDLKVQEKLKAAKNRALANKIKLMKIKGSAKGAKSIPSTERMYFLVAPPLEGKDKSCAKPIFIDKNGNVGKAIDSFSKILKIDNKNNDPTAPQLRLFNTSGDILSEELSVLLQTMVSDGSIVDGDSLILEYVTKEEIENGVNIFDGERCIDKYNFV
ncbi:AN1-type zinc finger protein 1 [Halyomorpha halys]|uniref:AN1-type zinc finger protein 1 n=1 Tax=Halyomorpha halys TaxID=286706 RepID=UPI0006D519F8|nr:AN1-type zinc finger protein 1 [Halyomorpha halys]